MDTERAREEVVLAGRTLVEAGLVARTWGNVSCRIDENRFAITPSGLSYEALRPQDIVVVNIADLSYEGRIKPSSEKGIHANVYKMKPEAGFVIHTHQANASVAGVLGGDVDIADPRNREIIGDRAVLADYALPGTKKLRENVSRALARDKSRAVLMARHGALCFGENRDEAFAVAQALENECGRYLVQPGPSVPTRLADSSRSGDKFRFESARGSVTLDMVAPPTDMPPEARLHQAIYRARKDIGVIMGSSLPYTLKASAEYGIIKPVLDDFAQLVGVSVHTVRPKRGDEGARRVVRALRGRNALLLKGVGALCCAGGHDDASAVKAVLEKGCMAYLSAAYRNALQPIPPIECTLMRQVYLLKYSHQLEAGHTGLGG